MKLPSKKTKNEGRERERGRGGKKRWWRSRRRTVAEREGVEGFQKNCFALKSHFDLSDNIDLDIIICFEIRFQ